MTEIVSPADFLPNFVMAAQVARWWNFAAAIVKNFQVLVI
jgi:hypothetical protein